MYYKFHGDDLEDEAAFDQRMDSLTREIGKRGQVQVSEAVPPSMAWAPTPAPAPAAQAPARAPARASAAPAPAPAPMTPQPAPAPDRTFTPSVSIQPAAAPAAGSMAMVQQSALLGSRGGGDNGGLEGVPAADLLQEQREEILAQRQEMERLREETVAARVAEAARPKLAVEVISEQQLAALQSRLARLHASSLLTDDELYALEDAVVDCIEMMSEAAASARDVGKVIKMISISEKVATDGTLARQLRRKYC